MNTLKATLLGIGGLFLLDSTTALAFHTEGTNECEGCHINHRRQNELPLDPEIVFSAADNGNNSILGGRDASSTCLNCHSEKMKVLSKDGSAYAPGGDFFWLTRNYTEEGGRSVGENHGHNVVSQDYRLNEDTVRVVAPSDGSVSYQSSWLSCTSCHDPHAKSRPTGDGGNYRLLGGIGYSGGGLAAGISFTSPAPIAKAYPSRDEQLPPETDRNHNAYGSGMSEWCTNCHSGLAGSGQHRHPAGNDSGMGILAQLYDSYVSSGNMQGTHDSAYDFLVPFEHGTDDPDALSTSSTEGPTAGSNVMCLSCHRAHASPFSSSGRWDFNSTLLAESAVLSSPEGKHAYYGEDITRRYVASQRSLCNKCHVKD